MQDFFNRFGLPDHLAADIKTYGFKLVVALLVLVIGIWIAGRLANMGRRAMNHAKVDITLVSFLRNVLFGLLLVMVIIAALSTAGIPSASFVAVLGAAGLAVGLALQGSLSNLAWGVLLIMFRPFKVGDFVQVGSYMGTVDRIDLMQTWLIAPDGRDVVIPNAKVGGDAVINFNARGTRRFEVAVGIGYEADIGKAMDAVRDLLKADKRVLDDPAPGVWTTELGDSSVNLVIRGWTVAADFWATQTDFVRAVKERFDAEGISIPFPQRDLNVRKLDADKL
ncbi:mechanosensitive ion channel family protein [Oleiagrimonas soli]|uniref:Small-conductance mechanosensitive channel n=1 Tax=Oleiagrimonas soli TaxID=1543381 RepID=A0A099CSG3_9GAMM|nr:mechanosensitive ion channel domain-containing protein [Oleiagrimonas soli]KGI76938.1 mechanosensitive ion channel protein MscS [Oleiagrimonas soli]MBB6185191.1 small conductance mechanosensitive channel [Oleiagrimonas soli]